MHKNLSRTKLEEYLTHLRTQAETELQEALTAAKTKTEIDRERFLDAQRNLVEMIFAWRNLNGSSWEAGATLKFDKSTNRHDIREVLRISTDDLIEDRYATAAKKKYNLSRTKLEEYLTHLRTQAEDQLEEVVTAIEEENDPERNLNRQRKLVEMIFAWRNLDGSSWEGATLQFDKSTLINIMLLFKNAPPSVYPYEKVRAFWSLCSHYDGLVSGEFRRALMRAWGGLQIFETRLTSMQIFERLTGEVSNSLDALSQLEDLSRHPLDLDDVENMGDDHLEKLASASQRLRTLAKSHHAAAASKLEDIKALASGLDVAGGGPPVRFFEYDVLSTASRAGWAPNDVDEFADQYKNNRSVQSSTGVVRIRVVPQQQSPVEAGKSKLEHFVLEPLRSDLAEKMERINENARRAIRRINMAKAAGQMRLTRPAATSRRKPCKLTCACRVLLYCD
ncbi:unnamed protein product, partial [Amoebophrya sp. A120]|eukprot:GSA120T00000589001.1